MTLAILLIPYLIVLSAWAIFSILIIGHLIHYSDRTTQTLIPISAYLIGSTAILIISVIVITGIDWSIPILSI